MGFLRGLTGREDRSYLPNAQKTKAASSPSRGFPRHADSCGSPAGHQGVILHAFGLPWTTTASREIRPPATAARDFRPSCRPAREAGSGSGRGWGCRRRAPRRSRDVRSLTTRTTTDPIRQRWVPIFRHSLATKQIQVHQGPRVCRQGREAGRGKPVAEGVFETLWGSRCQ
jgi:hypothetical protein